MRILITGGSGLIGTRLSERLVQLGHEVLVLTRMKKGIPFVKEISWEKIDDLDTIDTLVHLAGESIAGGRWTPARKQKIISSRVETLRFLSEKIKGCSVLVGASASGFYGGNRDNENLNENSTNGNDFLAECCQLWEDEEKYLAQKHRSRLVIIRTGLVLSGKGGALPLMALPTKYYLGTDLGSGQQWLSWIHIDDLVEMYIQSILDSSISGVFNGSTHQPLRFSEFNKLLAESLSRKIWLPNIPSRLLKLVLGDMSVLLLGSLKMSTRWQKPFIYPGLEGALNEIYK